MARVLVRPSRAWSTRDRLMFNCVEDENGCWRWLGAKARDDYGVCEKQAAHRLSYMVFVGPLPEDRPFLDHTCRVTSCIRPSHLEPVTNRQNVLRGVGLTALNARKTHCSAGHEYTEENTYRPPNGQRRCIKCKRAHGRTWMATRRSGV